MSLQPGNTLGSYQIVEKIGAGGMGSVYKAYQTSLGRYVAIKVLPPQTAGDPAFGERFALEARAIGKLRHPNIVTAFDFTQEGDVAFLVSDYIDGGTLADQLGAPLPLDYTLGIVGPLAGALDYAHSRGIVHRDIKPQNVLLGRDGTPVLTDFGLAKIVGPGSGMTQAGSLMGTADYMAPELAGGAEAAGPAADQYALGIIAYQMLVGRHPFPSDNPLSALMAHVNKPVPLPSQLGVVLPPGVEAALIRALAKKPEDRFPRSGDFVRALAGSQYSVPPTSPAATAFAAPGTSPSQPPVVASSAGTASASPFVSPSDLVSPVARVQPPPPAPQGAPAIVPIAAGGGAAAAVLTAPRAGGGFPWRRALVPGILVLVVAVLALRGGNERGAGLDRTNVPLRTAQRIAVPTVAPTVAPTTAPTVAPTAAPTVAPTAQPTAAAVADDYGNTPATAAAIEAGTYDGTIAPAGDVDFFRVMVPANTTIAVALRAETLPSGALTVFDASGTEVEPEVNTGADRVARVDYVARDPGAYFIRVRAARGADTTGTYTLTFSEAR
ncbi:MAG TPA: protein kinase [Candidatus Limnocylindria bacterium]|nr:protein kinase [Candidatus Limnocylindria bacterium]